MIKVPQPSMVLNSPDAPSRYRMYVTYDVRKTEDIDIALRQVRQAALRQPDKTLRCLIINCHGLYNGTSNEATGGYGLSLGTGIFARNVHHFGLLREGSGADSRGLVHHIWITACGTAAVSKVNAQTKGQETPYRISGFEGLTRQWAPDGRVTWEHEYSRWPLQSLFHGDN